MANWQTKMKGLVRDLRAQTRRLKDSVDERRLAVNIAPINDRRKSRQSVTKPAPKSYEWIIEAESGPLKGMRYAVAAPVVLGQSADCDLTLVTSQVSLHHTKLTLERFTLFVEDMESAIGTLLNGEPLVGRQPLQHGDKIQIHDSRFRVSVGFFRENSLDPSAFQTLGADSEVTQRLH
ncbi:MAG: FHA domain-containing protein [Halioglobus sp.]